MRIFFCSLFLTGFVFAQDFTCKSLLEALPATGFNDLTSFEANFSFTENDEPFTARLVRDVTGQRSYYELTEASGETSILRYEGDTGTLEKNGQIEVAPPEGEADVIGFFDIFLSQKIFSEAELVSCDGVQTLQTPEGDIEGEAITLTIMGDPGQLFFDDMGRVVGFSSSNDVGIFDSQYEDDLLVKSEFRIYSVETQALVRTMTFELVNYNQPVDASLFGETLECETLLETFKTQPEFTSLETRTTYLNDSNQPFDYKVVDFVKERVYWELNIDGTKAIYRLVDGQITGVTETNGVKEASDVPDYIRFPLESTFLSAASFKELAEKAVVLSCDGEQVYSDGTSEIVRGQQITVAYTTDTESSNAKLLFDDEGNFIGNYINYPDNDVLLVSSDIQKDDAGVTIEVTSATYRQEGETFELLSKTTTKTLSYNQPVNESLFDE
jgi:hypothetical protein